MSNPSYIRLNVTAGGETQTALTELTLRSVTSGPQVAIDSTTGTAYSYPPPAGSHTANCAFDGSLFTGQYWEVNANAGQLVFHFNDPAPKIVEYAITPCGWAAETPQSWTLETSENGTDWTVIDTRSGETGWSEGNTRTYTVPLMPSVVGYSSRPTPAWISAAQKTNRRPVLWLAIESVNALKRSFSDWVNAPASSDVNAGIAQSPRETVILKTDMGDEYAGEHTAPVSTGTTTHEQTHAILATFSVVTTVLTTPVPGEANVDFYDVFVELWGDRVGGGAEKLAGPILCNNGFSDAAGEFYADSRNLGVIVEGQFTNLRAVISGQTLQANVTWGGYYEPHGISAALVSHTDIYQAYYLPTGSIQTGVMDLGVVPTADTVVGVDATIIAGATLSVVGRGSNDLSTWTDLGTVADGDIVDPYRYYDFTATFTSEGATTYELKSISVSGGDNQFKNYSTHEGVPVQDAKPFLEMSLGTLSGKIELMKLGSIGEVSPKLFYLKDTFELIRDGYLRNKAVCLRYGFENLPEEDYYTIFTGLWYDYQLDLYRQRLTVTTRTILSRFQKVQLPKETAQNGRRTDDNTPVKEWINENIVSVMLNIIDGLGIQDRYIEQASFTDLISGARSGDDWLVSRWLDKDNKEDVLKLLEELSVLSGVFILQLPNGKLRALLYDPDAAPVKHIDAEIGTFSPIDGGQADLYTRQQICYTPKRDDDLETGTARGAWAVGVDIARGDTVTVSGVTWYCIQAHQSTLDNGPGLGFYRAFWATEWVTGAEYLAGEVCTHGGPLFTCSVTHTSGASTEPDKGLDWRTRWTVKPARDGNSAEDYYNAYVLINGDAEVNWGINSDVPEGDPDYLINPGYQKSVYDKWNTTAALRTALAARMDAWFAAPKMQFKVSDLPPTYICGSDKDYLLGKMVTVSGLMLPEAGAEWGTPCENKKFFVLSEELNTAKCTVTLGLLEV